MGAKKVKVMVVEDEESIRKFVTVNLLRSDFEVFEASSGEEAVEKLMETRPDVIILDIMLPEMDGFEVCQKVRSNLPGAAIIMLTAKDQDMDKIMGLDLGADDYMIKPFNPFELIARIRAILRRISEVKGDNDGIITHCGISLDINAQKVYKNNTELDLTPREFSIIKMFMEKPGIALSRDEILNTLWGNNFFGDTKTVDVHIRRLREKIEEVPSEPKIIETIWGFGYRLKIF
ncbi:MAG: Alkaline phosphatase synthesis transcriptional regulatory protein PhoP [Firmicutes bacterium ADurb.Bin419]|nr:MAG: Alkaline phosphatase synthesis transcriptional regulatory protein PhoP [Firmicutes bacterium ADurb.Bin419]